jgi:hypothetical protein
MSFNFFDVICHVNEEDTVSIYTILFSTWIILGHLLSMCETIQVLCFMAFEPK